MRRWRKEELGGAYVHSSKSGVTHFVCDTEEETLMSIRELLSFLPSNNMEDAPSLPCSDDIRRETETLQTVIPDDPNVPYDMKDVIEPVVDNHYFFEVMSHLQRMWWSALPVWVASRLVLWRISRLS